MKTRRLSGKETVPRSVVSKEDLAESLVGHKKNPIPIDFIEKDETANSASY